MSVRKPETDIANLTFIFEALGASILADYLARLIVLNRDLFVGVANGDASAEDKMTTLLRVSNRISSLANGAIDQASEQINRDLLEKFRNRLPDGSPN